MTITTIQVTQDKKTTNLHNVDVSNISFNRSNTEVTH